MTLYRRQRLGAIAGELDIVALEAERPIERLANGAVIVDNKDAHLYSSFEWRFAQSHRGAEPEGLVRVKLRPRR